MFGSACILAIALALLLAPAAGCSQESLWIALESQQRADQVHQAVFDRQHDALRILLFRDVSQRLVSVGVEPSPEVIDVLNDAWNERDLIEFWQLQHERARALRLVGVDARLYGDQNVAELLYKSFAAKWDRAEDALAAEIGRRLTESAAGSARDSTGEDDAANGAAVEADGDAAAPEANPAAPDDDVPAESTCNDEGPTGDDEATADDETAAGDGEEEAGDEAKPDYEATTGDEEAQVGDGHTDEGGDGHADEDGDEIRDGQPE